MSSLPLNLDNDAFGTGTPARRDLLIFGKPLDWQSIAAQNRRVSFDKLPLSRLQLLLQEGFVQASDQPLSDPDALELVEVARCLSRPSLPCWVEVLVSPPVCQEFVRITAIRFEGAIAPAERSFFWQSFYHVRTLEMTPWLLRATFESAALLFISHPVMAYQIDRTNPPVSSQKLSEQCQSGDLEAFKQALLRLQQQSTGRSCDAARCRYHRRSCSLT